MDTGWGLVVLQHIAKAPSYLVKHRHLFYFRVVVPVDLRDRLGRTELRLSLATAYLTEARAKASRGVVAARAIFERLRKEAGTMAELTTAQIKELAGQWLREMLDLEEERRRDRKRPWDEEQLEDHLEALVDWEGSFREALALSDYRGVSGHVDNIVQEHGLEAPPDSPAWRALAREVLKAAVALHKVERRRSVGDYSDSELGLYPPAGLPSPTGPGQTTGAVSPDSTVPAIPLGQLVDTFIKEKVRDKEWSTERSRQAGEAKLRFFLSIVGPDLGHTQLTKQHLREVNHVLKHIPERMTMRKEYRDLSLAQIMAMKIPDKDKLAPGTLGTYIHPINNFLGWLAKWYDGIAPGLHEVLDTASAAAAEKGKRKVLHFTTGDLRRIFNSEEYRKDSFKKPWQFWLPPLLLFTGARLEEICQLNLDDVRQWSDEEEEEDYEGVGREPFWVITVTEDPGVPDGRHVKNPSSRRLIPLHPFLVEDLNLPGYVARLRSFKKTRLFPEFEKRSGRYGHYASRWFNEGAGAYKRRVGIFTDDPLVNKTLHSFRHSFYQRAVLLGCAPLMVDQLTGHKTTKQVANLDQGGEMVKVYTHGFPLRMRYEDVILKLDFGVDLSHLARSKYVVKRRG